MPVAITVYDSVTAERFDLVEFRQSGHRLYDNAAGVRVVAYPETMSINPPTRRPRNLGWPITAHGPMPDINDELRRRIKAREEKMSLLQAAKQNDVAMIYGVGGGGSCSGYGPGMGGRLSNIPSSFPWQNPID